MFCGGGYFCTEQSTDRFGPDSCRQRSFPSSPVAPLERPEQSIARGKTDRSPEFLAGPPHPPPLSAHWCGGKSAGRNTPLSGRPEGTVSRIGCTTADTNLSCSSLFHFRSAPRPGPAMIDVDKHLVTDEDGTPVAVQIRYEDWLRLEAYLSAASPPAPHASSSPPDSAHVPQDGSPLDDAGRQPPDYSGAAFRQRLLDEWPGLDDEQKEAQTPADHAPDDRLLGASGQDAPSADAPSADAPSASSANAETSGDFDSALDAARGSWPGEEDAAASRPERAVRSGDG